MSTSTDLLSSFDQTFGRVGMAAAISALLVGAWAPRVVAQPEPIAPDVPQELSAEEATAPPAPPPASFPPPPPPPVVLEVAPGPAALPPPPPPSSGEQVNIGFAYSMSFPVGDLHDFIGKPAYRGFDFVALWPIFRSFYIGGAFHYNLLHEDRDHTTYQLDSGAVTAKLFDTANFWMTSLVTRYAFLTPDSLFRPYLGVRLGVAALSTNVQIADFSFNDNPVGFLLVPEGGVQIRFTDFILGSIAYQYNFTTADSGRFKNLSFGALQFGLVMRVGS